MAQSTRQSVLFEGTFSKTLTVEFDGDTLSSDGGLVLLGALDRGIKLTERLVRHFADPREPSKVQHEIAELFRQRVFAIAGGYADWARDKAESRFARGRELVTAARELEDVLIERHAKRRGRKTRLVTIDLDPTDDPTHGQQQFAFFNGHYDSWCFLPLLGFISFDDEREQFLCAARLRPGNASATRAAFPQLRRLVAKLRSSFPKAAIRVRLDGGFATPRTFAILEELGVEYVVGLPGNKRLDRLAGGFRCDVRVRSKASG